MSYIHFENEFKIMRENRKRLSSTFSRKAWNISGVEKHIQDFDVGNAYVLNGDSP